MYIMCLIIFEEKAEIQEQYSLSLNRDRDPLQKYWANSEKFGHPEFFRYCRVLRYFVGSLLKSEGLVIRNFSANAGFSAIFQYAIAGFYCTQFSSLKTGNER